MRDWVERNVGHWTGQAPAFAVSGRRSWATDEVTWGELHVPEADLGVLPDVRGARVAEVGCGTAYVSAWLARRGASVVGLDPTPAQLATARALGAEIGPPVPLVQAIGEQAPLRSGAFDLVVSEYGAALWADPHEWIPEAHRLLRPGGELVFLTNAVLFTLCAPDEEAPAGTALVRDQAGLHRVEYTDDIGVEFHLAHGDMLRLLRRTGFEVLDLVELHAGERPPSSRYIDHGWARRWPAEEIWRARKR